jgi:hypothetical protein
MKLSLRQFRHDFLALTCRRRLCQNAAAGLPLQAAAAVVILMVPALGANCARQLHDTWRRHSRCVRNLIWLVEHKSKCSLKADEGGCKVTVLLFISRKALSKLSVWAFRS